MRDFFNRFRRKAESHATELKARREHGVIEVSTTRRQRVLGAVKNLASDANTAVTQFRCARLARTLRRNDALANAAREELS